MMFLKDGSHNNNQRLDYFEKHALNHFIRCSILLFSPKFPPTKIIIVKLASFITLDFVRNLLEKRHINE